MDHFEPLAISSFLDGTSVALGQRNLDLVRPSDGTLIGTILEAGSQGVAAAVSSARLAGKLYGSAPLHRRVELLHIAGDALEEASEDLARLVCEDVGKPIRIARVEAKRGVDFVRACAAAASQLGGETVPVDAASAGAGCFGFVQRIPYGVVAAITPFNAPINLLLQKVAPAVAAGNTVVAKPAPAGLRAALLIAAIFSRAGWPNGLFNVLSGDRETAAALVTHADVRAVSFTGGTAAGEALARLAGAKKFLAELGSNAANIVFADADIRAAAIKISSAGFEASGQQCISAQRVIVQKSTLHSFLELFVLAATALQVGPATDPASDIGPMVNAASADRVMAIYQDACDRGATVVLAPRRESSIVSPAILMDVPRSARLWREEVFGPMVVISSFETEDEALSLANDSEFGLQGAVFTSNLGTALRFAREFDVGSLWINEASRFRLDMYPFGGVKSSGYGREGLRYAIEELSQLKFVGIRA
jgi:acyl-CoA reductase-like NAD-dependent aldehyde dehydrogenase